MSAAQKLRIDDLLREAAILTKDNPEGFSTRELAKAANCSDTLIRTRLKDLAIDGKIAVGRRREVSIDGRSCLVPVYRVVKGKK